MRGEGIAVLEVAGANVGLGDLNRLVVAECECDRVIADRGDPTGIAVHDAEPSIVAARDHAITRGERAAVRGLS
jgi:hypothetical protein